MCEDVENVKYLPLSLSLLFNSPNAIALLAKTQKKRQSMFLVSSGSLSFIDLGAGQPCWPEKVLCQWVSAMYRLSAYSLQATDASTQMLAETFTKLCRCPAQPL